MHELRPVKLGPEAATSTAARYPLRDDLQHVDSVVLPSSADDGESLA